MLPIGTAFVLPNVGRDARCSGLIFRDDELPASVAMKVKQVR